MEIARTPGRRRRRSLTAVGLLVGLMIGLVGLAPAANAKPAEYTPQSCSGPGCGPCPTGVTWRSLFGGILIGYKYVVQSSVPTFFTSDARQVSNGLSTPISVTVSSQTSRTHTVTTTVGSSVDLLSVLHASVSVSIVSSTTTSIGVSVTAQVQPFSSILAEYGMHGYSIVYDATQYLTTRDDLNRNVCGNNGTRYGLSTVGPTLVQGWRITSI